MHSHGRAAAHRKHVEACPRASVSESSGRPAATRDGHRGHRCKHLEYRMFPQNERVSQDLSQDAANGRLWFVAGERAGQPT